jgi:hypothetical protein
MELDSNRSAGDSDRGLEASDLGTKDEALRIAYSGDGG